MYLILEFKNAKLIRTHKDTKDRVSYFGSKSFNRKDTDFKNFKEPITKFQISNLLHVLMGERPINTQRYSNYDNQKWIMSLAEKCLLKYNTPIIQLSKDKQGYPSEKTTINKSAWDSWSAINNINWEIVKNYCENNFDDILKEFEKVFQEPLKRKFYEIAKEISENVNKYDDILLKISSLKGKKGLDTYLRTLVTKSVIANYTTSKRKGTALTITRGVDNAEFYSGEIIVPIDNDILNLIRTHYKGTSTILDGGLVSIKSIKSDLDEEYFEGFTKVNDISIEKV